MLVLALALQLSGEARLPASLDLVPSLTLSAQADAPPPSQPSLAPALPLPESEIDPARGRYVVQGLGAAMGHVMGDMLTGLASVGCFMTGFLFAYGHPDREGNQIFLAAQTPCLALWLVSTTFGVKAAVREGAPPDHARRAFWLGVLARSAGAALAVAVFAGKLDGALLDDGAAAEAALPVFLASELVVAPAVIVTALHAGAPAPAPPPAPAQLARPVRDPASPWGA
jgi:hypothetical protein